MKCRFAGHAGAVFLLALALPAFSQEPGAEHVVTYFETLATPLQASSTTPVEALRRYVEAISHEGGAGAAEILQETVRPGRFVVLEQWSDLQSLEQHRAAPSIKQLDRDLSPWLSNPYDRRIHGRVE